jgi:hypothetical protein
MSRITVLLIVVTASIFASGQQSTITTDPFGPLEFLVGSWRGEQSGEPGKGISGPPHFTHCARQGLGCL